MDSRKDYPEGSAGRIAGFSGSLAGSGLVSSFSDLTYSRFRSGYAQRLAVRAGLPRRAPATDCQETQPSVKQKERSYPILDPERVGLAGRCPGSISQGHPHRRTKIHPLRVAFHWCGP